MLRQEIHTRSAFAKSKGEYWFKKMKSAENIGNVVSSAAKRKFVQAHRIYTHYNNEFTKYINGHNNHQN